MNTPASSGLSLPGSNTAVVLSWFDAGVESFDEIVQMLTGRGYQVAPTHTMDLPTLRSLPSQPIGVLYASTHGLVEVSASSPTSSQGSPSATTAPTPLLFGLATTMPTSVTAADLSAADWAALQADLNAMPPRLTPSAAPNMTRGANGLLQPNGSQNVYFATTAFFEHYWGQGTFAPNSLVFVNGCYSADDGFQKACTAAGGGLILGWTLPVKSEDAAATADFFFDRMLGANDPKPQFFPELLPQRPFTWPQVQQEFNNHQSVLQNKLGTSWTLFNGEPSDVTLSPVSNGTPGLLVPSIVWVGAIEFTKELKINGSFGPDPGSAGAVNFLESLGSNPGGNPLQIKSWTPKLITCALPAGASDVGQSCGYVVVSVDRRRSNCIPLTKWSGEIVATAIGDQSLRETVTFTCNFRIDAHPYRTDFSSKLNSGSYMSVPRTTIPSPDSTCRYAATGFASYSDPVAGASTRSLSGGGSFQPASALTMTPTSGPPVAFNIIIELDSTLDGSLSETHSVKVTLFMPQQEGTPPKYSVQLTTQSPDQGPTVSDLDAISFCGVFGAVQLLNSATTYDLPDPKAPLTDQGGVFPSAVLDVTIDTACPPDPKMGEDYLPLMSS
jgi:hypothetical protein